MENYNGYSNRETWAVALHIGNTEAIYNEFKHAMWADSAIGISSFFYNCKDYGLFAKALEDIGDLALVNWAEVAEAVNL